jgi:hypothetical protein
MSIMTGEDQATKYRLTEEIISRLNGSDLRDDRMGYLLDALVHLRLAFILLEKAEAEEPIP